MKVYLYLLFVLILFTIDRIPVCAQTRSPKIAQQEYTDHPKITRLFNGRDLSGWYTYLQGRGRGRDPKTVFKVENGAIRISGEEWGCITTEKPYANYRLVIEYKWGEKTFAPREKNARDGGVLVHSQGADGAYGGQWMHSIECQIIEGGTGDVLVVEDGSNDFSITSTVRSEGGKQSKVFEPAGKNQITISKGRIDWHSRDPNWKDIIGYRGSKDVEKALGEWNALEIIANGADIKIFLNNQFVNHVFNSTPREGRIQIQSEGAEMFFRRVDLVPLPPDFRFSYNSDGNNMFGSGEDTPEELYPIVDEVALAGVTSFFISPHFGMTMNFPTKVGDMVGENLSKELEANVSESILNVRTLVANGHDPLGVMLERAKAHRMETFVSFRLNEVHGVDQKDSYLFDQFWREHPEWRMGKYGDPVPKVVEGDALPAGLNFAVPEVREYRLAQFREICERFDIDGLEIDFQRFPMYFKSGEESSGLKIMTGWIEEVRAMVKEVGKKRGRPVLLGARILALPEHNKGIGLDPVTWAQKRLLDFVTVSHVSHNDFQLPVAEYRKLFPLGFPVYASIEVESGMKRYRQVALPLWRQNVNGVYLFNFFVGKSRYDGYRKRVCKSKTDRTTVACGLGETPPPYDSIREIGYPVVTKDSVLLVANKHSNTLSYVDPATFDVIKTIPAGQNPDWITVTPDQKTAYLCNYRPSGNSISVIDLMSGRKITEIATGYYSKEPIHGAAMSPDGRYAYFTAGQSDYVIIEIETLTQEISRTIPTHGKSSRMVYVSPDGKYLMTGNVASGEISVITRSTGELYKKITAGKGVEGMAFTPDRKFLWALNQDEGSITIINMETLEVAETIKCPGMPQQIRFTADGKKALVAGRLKEGGLAVIDVASKKVRGINAGNYVNGITLSPDEKYVFAGSDNSPEQGVPAAAQGKEPSKDDDCIQVIDMMTLEVVSTMKTGLGPDPAIMWYPAYR